MKAKIKDLTISLSGEQNITFALQKGEDARQLYDNLHDKELELTIKKYYPKRSLQANRYCWKLITEISSILRTTNEEIYLDMLIKYGQTDIIQLSKGIDVSRYVDYYRLLEADLDTNTYLIAIGSSKYNSSEMSRLIEGIVDDAKSLGIQTETPNEIARMVSLWKGE
jgi:hypothetical protein